MITINYEAEVKKVYPESTVDEFYRLETLFRIKTNKGYIGDWVYTPGSAWESAYKQIKRK